MATAKAIFDFETLRQRFPASEIELVNAFQFDNGLALQGNSYEVPAIDRAAKRFQEQRPTTDFDSSLPTDYPQGKKYAGRQQRAEERLNDDFNRRRDSTRYIAQQQAVANVGSNQIESVFPRSSREAIEVVYGVMQPMWVQDELLLVRPLTESGQTRYQCCWLNWEKIQNVLRTEVAQLLPPDAIQFDPVQLDEDLQVGMALTTLPVQLSIDRQKLRTNFLMEGGDDWAGQSSAGTILSLAWIGFLLSTVAATLLLGGVISLSERRANFVSAVTHELRTPLTTFRMYSDMLASDMVPPDKQQQYVSTLSQQADRLSHLVENVLQFARLERNPTQDVRESMRLGDMVDRFADRLLRRSNEAGLQFKTVYSEAAEQSEISTVPAMVEQVLFNLVDNACKYGKPSRTNELTLAIGRAGNRIEFQVCDNGPGVDAKTRRKMFQPFHKSDLDAANSEPGVGLGLALCQRMAVCLGGALEHRDNKDGGATFVLSVPASHAISQMEL